MKAFFLILMIFSLLQASKLDVATSKRAKISEGIPEPLPLARKLSITHLSKQLKKIKLTPSQRELLVKFNDKIQSLSEKDQTRLGELVEGTQSENPKVRARSWRKIQGSRKLVSTGLKVMMGLGGGALGLFILGFFRQSLAIRRLKKEWKGLERKLFYSKQNKETATNSLSSNVANLIQKVGMFSDHLYAKSSEISNFVDGRPIF